MTNPFNVAVETDQERLRALFSKNDPPIVDPWLRRDEFVAVLRALADAVEKRDL